MYECMSEECPEHSFIWAKNVLHIYTITASIDTKILSNLMEKRPVLAHTVKEGNRLAFKQD